METLILTPLGHLRWCEEAGEGVPGAELSPAETERLRVAFAESAGAGLLRLAGLARTGVSPVLAFWRRLGYAYITQLCHLPDLDKNAPPSLPPPVAELARAVEEAPPMRGLEYLTAEVLERAWCELDAAARAALAAHPGTAAEFLHALNPLCRLVGRVTFHLAENKKNAAQPFAFLATYTSRVSAQAKPQYLPLSRALQEYADAQNKAALLSLLQPVQRAAESSPFIAELVKSGRVYQPQAWLPQEAYRFLQDIPRFEAAGVLVRVPDWWKSGRPPRPQVTASLGAKPPARLGQDALLDFSVRVSMDGETLSPEEMRAILAATGGLVQIKGKWAEVDAEKLQAALAHFEEVAKRASADGLSFHEGMRLLAGADGGLDGQGVNETDEAAVREWGGVSAGPWLKTRLAEMRDPARLAESAPPPGLRAELRPYQQTGVNWLAFMGQLGLGACLADDMGLGKTIQVLGLLLKRKAESANAGTSLLVVPASLVANWKAEIAKFAPGLRVFLAHPSETTATELAACAAAPIAQVADLDLVITTYSMLVRQEWLQQPPWQLVVLDEAQAIKNPGTRQAKAVKRLQAQLRIALTGTPVENRLSDLWSLFDFINPGLLGSVTKFARYSKQLASAAADAAPGVNPYAPLRNLTRPYILRRMKTDRSIIRDLPDKTEVDAWCALSPEQATLYAESVRQLAIQLAEEEEGIKRKGVVLAFLTRFKQICNHPAQWLGHGDFAPAASGKFQRLREIAEELAERQEKMLIFTQFQSLCEPLCDFLGTLFGRPGLLLHGGTAVGKRRELVEAFQREDGPPFFVLSLKAGGTGLNLTAASHVVHFDRWWNPAVEDQATDRAFRIGQKRNVMIHKFVCRGTLEEKIAALIAEKRGLADSLLGAGGEKLLTEMGNEELLRFVALDLKRVAAD